jgi:hypothetical protein
MGNRSKTHSGQSTNPSNETAPVQGDPGISQDEATTRTTPTAPNNGEAVTNARRDGTVRDPTEGDPEETVNPRDLNRLRMAQNFARSKEAKILYQPIPVRKPGKELIFRVHPDRNLRVEARLLELKEGRYRGLYYVVPDLWDFLSSESTISIRLLVMAMTHQGLLFLWPLRLPDAEGNLDSWSESALEALELAETAWIRMEPDSNASAYRIVEKPECMGEPDWSGSDLQKCLDVGFKTRTIDSLDHPVLRYLDGRK